MKKLLIDSGVTIFPEQHDSIATDAVNSGYQNCTSSYCVKDGEEKKKWQMREI